MLKIRRMGRVVDLLELPDGEMRVDLDGLEIQVAQPRMEEPDVGAAFMHQRSHGVTEQVAGTLVVGGDASGTDLNRPGFSGHSFS